MPQSGGSNSTSPDQHHHPSKSSLAPPEAGLSKADLRIPAGYPSSAWRWVISCLIGGYMLVVVLGPLSNPVGPEFLIRPLARAVSPIHRGLFLGHGYRFFGPDPGPSHIVVYRIIDRAGEGIEKRFPDRDEIWPRLLYHRWFMLSETVYQEISFLPDEESFQENDQELARQIEALNRRGKKGLAQRLTDERARLQVQYQDSRARVDQLIEAIAKQLLVRHQGESIELFLQERSIPFPVAVLTGQSIDDPDFLSPLRKLGDYRLDADGNLQPLFVEEAE